MANIPKNLLDELEKVLSVVPGPELLYETARQNVYSGSPPWPLDEPKKRPQPFEMIRDFHSVFQNGKWQPIGKRKPILTSDDAANPQLPQAMGVDLVTLVAQILHEPAVVPPSPRTDAGPPTFVPDRRR